MEWLKAGGWSTAGPATPAEGAAPRPGAALLLRYASDLAELLAGTDGGPEATA